MRSAVHDPWRAPRHFGFPGGMPSPPALLIGSLVVLFAFLLGRCTAGSGNEVATDTANTTVATLATTTTGFAIIHTVKANETLASIAAQYSITINDIAIANNIGNLNNIQVGERLKIPAPTPITTTTTTRPKKKAK